MILHDFISFTLLKGGDIFKKEFQKSTVISINMVTVKVLSFAINDPTWQN